MGSPHTIRINVKCYAGYRGEETPRAICFSEKEILVDSILDMWLAPDHRYFKCLGNDNAVYIIRHDVQKCCWELAFYKEIPDGEHDRHCQ